MRVQSPIQSVKMLFKPESACANPSAALPACGNCGVEERRILHHVRHRGLFRRLCTSCVLRLHSQSFCPTCFQVYPPTPPSAAALGCYKCYSSSHSSCVEAAAAPSSPPTPYVCPLCTQPNAPIFKPSASGGDGCWAMNRDSAKKLLAAATIASASMNKAAAAARAEAERRAKEAAYTRKRAKEALEYVAHLVMKEKRRNEEAAAGGVGIEKRRNEEAAAGGVGINVNRVNNNCINPNAGYRNGSVGTALGRMDGSIQVLADLNAVGLKENGKMNGGIVAGQGVVPMDVDVDGERTVNDGSVNFVGNVDGLDISDDDVDLVRALEEQMQQDDDEEENSDGGEDHAKGPHL